MLCAGAPDTPEIAAEVRVGVERLRAERGGVIWIEEMLPKADVIQLLSHATVFACPSIYEPLGIVNLEAMACETAVVASAVGGIVEVVDDGVTGLLVPLEIALRVARAAPTARASSTGSRPAINELVRDPDRAAAMGRAGRERARSSSSPGRRSRSRPPRSTARCSSRCGSRSRRLRTWTRSS